MKIVFFPPMASDFQFHYLAMTLPLQLRAQGRRLPLSFTELPRYAHIWLYITDGKEKRRRKQIEKST